VKATIFNLLIQLFEAMGTNRQSDAEYFQYCVKTLKSAGLSRQDLNHALSWLDKFSKGPKNELSGPKEIVRIFSEEENQKINLQGRSFLLQLLHLGAIDRQTLEHILECVTELEISEINLNQLKWIVIMLASAEFKNQAYAEWLEHTILREDGPIRVLH
jgi:Smg protein